MYENNVLILSKEKRLQRFLFCLAVLLIGILFVFYSPVIHAHANPISYDDELYYIELRVKTPLYNGDVVKALRYKLWPMVKTLAAGKMPNDKITWNFEDALFYVDDLDEEEAKNNLEYRFAPYYLREPGIIASTIGEEPIGIYIDSFSYAVETRKIKDSKGNDFYRCALTEISVREWCSPYGPICSREEALNYYSKYQKQLKRIVSKLRTVRQSNGKPLTNEQKLKWIHDWLITSADYDEEGLEEAEKQLFELGGACTYRHLYNEYGPIIEGKTVCEGYAYAFKAVVDELVRQTGIKIECEIVYNNDHAWNRVKLNGKWYHVDLTWDDNGEEDLFHEKTDSSFFLVSDRALLNKHPGGESGYYTHNPTKATDRKYEGKTWPRYQKDLSEYTVKLKKSDKTYTYIGKDVVPSVVVKYGSNVLPKKAYQVVRMDKNKTGVAKIRIIPSKNCYALKGSIKGPNFKIVDGRISGDAKSTKKYKLGNSKSIRPFDKEFQPFASIYKYNKKPVAAKTANKTLMLKKGVDYTVKYSNNKKPGWATATIILRGKYAGKIIIKYKITK